MDNLIKCQIGNGKNIFLWFNNWLPCWSIKNKYGPRVIFNAGLSKEAKLSGIIKDVIVVGRSQILVI